MTLNELAKETRKINDANGWNQLTEVLHPWDDQFRIPAILALIHSEVSEALEAFRNNDRAEFDEEIADIIIRCLDLTSAIGTDIQAEVAVKLERNSRRGHRHGGKRV